MAPCDLLLFKSYHASTVINKVRTLKQGSKTIGVETPEITNDFTVNNIKNNLMKYMYDKSSAVHGSKKEAILKNICNGLTINREEALVLIKTLEYFTKENKHTRSRTITAAINQIITTRNNSHHISVSNKPYVKSKSPVTKIKPKKSQNIDSVLSHLQYQGSIARHNNSRVLETSQDRLYANFNYTKRDGKANLDVVSLQEYLIDLERKDKIQREMKDYEKSKKQIYDWTAQVGAADLSAAQLLFCNSEARQVFKGSGISRMISHLSLKNNEYHNTVKEEALILNMNDNSQVFTSFQDYRRIFQLIPKSVIHIIQKSSCPPEHILALINKYEKEGWSLYGVEADNYSKIVFLKVNTAMNSKGTVFTLPYKTIASGIILACGFLIFSRAT